jgi:hypothetical protein
VLLAQKNFQSAGSIGWALGDSKIFNSSIYPSVDQKFFLMKKINSLKGQKVKNKPKAQKRNLCSKISMVVWCSEILYEAGIIYFWSLFDPQKYIFACSILNFRSMFHTTILILQPNLRFWALRAYFRLFDLLKYTITSSEQNLRSLWISLSEAKAWSTYF